jgi:hypothetical protein
VNNVSETFCNSAQVPEVYPAQVAEDICPVTINFSDYFMSGSIWRKFNSKFPDVPFDVFMSRKIEKCEKKNLDVKNVFAHARNRLCHDYSHRRRLGGSEPSSAVAGHEDPPSFSSPLAICLRLKLLIPLKKQNMSICTSTLINLFVVYPSSWTMLPFL